MRQERQEFWTGVLIGLFIAMLITLLMTYGGG